MKKIKSVRKAWKKFAAVFLSMVLTVGLVSGALPFEVFAADDKIVITGQLTLEGYEGDGDIPETLIFGGHTLYRDSDEERPISAGEYNIVDGNVVVWRVEIEPEAELRQICLNIRNRSMDSDKAEYCWTWNVSGDDFSVSQVYTFEDTLYRIRLMDVNSFYRDVYIGKGMKFRYLTQSMSAPVTMKENHVFEGWNTLEGDFSLDMTASEPMTLYAFYSGHPAKEAWVWNHDDNGHWLECTCGKRENEETHVWDTGKVVTEPTDTDPGEKVFRCMHANCGYERFEVIRSTINYSIIMNGYNNGGELPNTANIELWLWKEGSSIGEPSQKVALKCTRIEGNQFFYSCDIQNLDTYAEAYIVDGSGFRFPLVDAFLQDGVYEKEFEYYRFRFMNGSEIYNEQYLFSSTWLQVPPTPVKENRVFVGWETSDGTIVDLDELKDAAVTERTILYAVWEHPADDEWEWKSDGDNHWKECNCGDKEDNHPANWDEGVVTKEPTDTEAGKKVYKCKTCGLMKEVTIQIDGSETEEDGDEGEGSEPGGGTGTEGGNESGGGTGTEGGSETGGGTGTEGGSEPGGGTGTEGGGSETGGGTGTEGGSETGGGTGTEGGSETGGGTGTEGGSETGGGTGTEGGGSESGGETGTEGGGNEIGGGTGTEGGGNESGGGTGTEGGGNETGGGTGTESGGSSTGGNGSGTGNTGNGSGTGNTGSGSGAGGTGSGNVAGGTGSGSGAGGTGSGTGIDGTGSGTGNAGSGSVFGNADNVMGSGAGRAGTADGTGTGEEIANEADGAGTENVDRGGSGAAHGNNRSMENGNTSYTAQNTSTANNDDAAVNSGRRTGRDDEPDTGDITHVEIYATIAMIAGLSYLLSYFRDENHGITEEEKNEMVAKLIGWAKKGGYFRKKLALAAIFLLLVYYHSIEKRVSVTYRLAEEEIL